MSDFDKEAERERLREKYEAESEGREATQRMSELLLKGATMTNSHCGNCGDPIFRYDGTEFCPTCNADGQGTVEDATERDAAANADRPTADGQPADATADRQPADATADGQPADATADAASGIQSGTGDVADATESDRVDVATTDAAQSARRAPPSQTDATHDRTDQSHVHDTVQGRPTDRNAPGRDSPTQSAGRADSQPPVAVDDDAVANVEATLQRFAAAANQTDDPERARECLDVVRDAADTLRSLHADTR
jgi:uncharacterized Zn finger protein (UPF0148 family)